MKKLLILTLISACSTIASVAQQDPKAKEILDRVSVKNKEYTSIQADYELTIQNRRDNITSSSKGSIKIKGEKYYMESPGNKVYHDGITLWTYMEDINEVSITEPEKGSDDFIDNPAIIFDFYNRDFKSKVDEESIWKMTSEVH